MTRVKDVARQVVEALPHDASFSDLAEFLFEREMVEAGRDDLQAGLVARRSGAVWSNHAAKALGETLLGSHSSSASDTRAFEAIVTEASDSRRLLSATVTSLPEMGDATIREVPIRTARIRYRLLYEVVDGTVRVLWFTSNVTCYRNVRG
jgi:hypothetical protein